MKSIIIAEKPKYATSIAKALMTVGERFKREDGYLESTNYVITWAIGHLLELYAIEDYDNVTSTAWNEEILPYAPDKFLLKLKDDKGIQKQYNTIKSLMNRNDITEIVHAGDNDEEGTNLIMNATEAIKKEIGKTFIEKRLWAEDQTESVIIKSLKNLKDVSYYNNYLNASRARTFMDFLVGINLTRKFTLMNIRVNKSKDIFSIGRCNTAIVNIIYEADKAIEEFTPVNYYQLESEEETNNEIIKLIDKDKFEVNEKNNCEELAGKLNDAGAKVINITDKIIKKEPKNLFSLPKIQGYLSKKYKITMEDSLSIIQKLYENGFVTYPRTDSEYLTESEKDKVRPVLRKLKENGINVEMNEKSKVFNNDLVDAHSALIITEKFPKEEQLNEVESIVYNTIKNRLICNFLNEKTEISQTIIEIEVLDRIYKIKGEAIHSEGYFKFEPMSKSKDKIILPKVEKGDIININFKPVVKKTTPPPKLTISELIKILENPFRKEFKNATDEYKSMIEGVSIGTPATRSGLIKNIKGYGYVEEVKGTLSITTKGRFLIESLNSINMNLTKEKTVEFSKMLKKVFKNELDIDSCIRTIMIELNEMFNNIDESKLGSYKGISRVKEVEIIGRCPLCGKNVKENKKGYACEGVFDKSCTFSMWKEDKFFKSKGKTLSKSVAKRLLANGQAHMTGLMKKDNSGKYSADILLRLNGKYVNYEMKFK